MLYPALCGIPDGYKETQCQAGAKSQHLIFHMKGYKTFTMQCACLPEGSYPAVSGSLQYKYWPCSCQECTDKLLLSWLDRFLH